MLTLVIVLGCFNYYHLLFVYLHELTLSVCVWGWSCNMGADVVAGERVDG